MARKHSNIYKPGSEVPFNVSRSKIALFLECPQCFWLDRRRGIARPETFPLNLNNAVDHLLKAEFDVLREQKQPHRLMYFHRIEAIPFWHQDLHLWRDDQKRLGAYTLHRETNLNIHGMIDDIWENTRTKELHIVDYKATSTDRGISIESDYRAGYRQQMDVYQWIFTRMGFPVSKTGYFLFANASKNKPGFHNKLEFENSIIPYEGKHEWIEPVIFQIKECLESDEVPESSKTCQHCSYRKLIEKEALKNQMSLI